MRALIVLMIAVAIAAFVLATSPSLRAKAEAILFRQQSAAPPPVRESEKPVSLSQAAGRTGEAVKKTWGATASKVAEAKN